MYLVTVIVYIQIEYICISDSNFKYTSDEKVYYYSFLAAIYAL